MEKKKFPMFPIILIVLGLFWLAQEMNWITKISFLPILLIIIGLGILLNENK